MSRTEPVTGARMETPAADWERLEPRYDEGIGTRSSLGLIALATDRAGALDFEEFVRPAAGVSTFTTRLPMDCVATPETLAAMGPHIEDAARLLVPGSRLDAVAFSCTSGTVAIGPDRVRDAIRRARPGIHVTTPIEAGAEGLAKLGCRRISLLVPYLVETAGLISGYLERQGIEILRRATLDLEGDPDMNRVSPDCLVDAGREIFDPSSDGLFISCTGLRTAPVVERLERLIGKPVVTSNQALAWHSLRLTGVDDRLENRGSLFSDA